jgi:hypothetical protein
MLKLMNRFSGGSTVPMLAVRHIAAGLLLVCLASGAAMGFEPLTAAIRVSSGGLYDYVVIGEHPNATDGYDNAYDTISPGNLNADMGEPYISVVVSPPDWKAGRRELRGDIRSLAKRQEWQLTVTSSLPAGTPLKVELQPDRTRLPGGLKLVLREGPGKETDLRTASFSFPAGKPGTKSELVITIEQP